MTATQTDIDIADYVIMRQPPQPKRIGELLKLAARLIGELPAPRNVDVTASGQEISLGFDGSASGLKAMAAWAGHYHVQLTGEHTTLSDGTPAVRCELSFDRDGAHIRAYTYLRPQANGDPR